MTKNIESTNEISPLNKFTKRTTSGYRCFEKVITKSIR
ncbi:unnamed protein product [Schistosoma curassoni]|uniref:Uncharacterized protein n=1 Tax=Schistosoma curassoni TaxID=6186 RepID=A0A183JR34_9TREM|nr:unnamed protein product [Schistosoma curassoni]